MSRSNPYVKTTWVDEETELSAEQLNRIEQGIYNAHDAIIDTEDDLAATKANLIEEGTTDTAKKAVSDSNGNPIDSTYATKTENNLNLLKGDGTGTQYMYDALKIQTFLIAQLIKSFGDKIRINLIDDNETTALEILVNYNESNQVRLLLDAAKLQVTNSNNKKFLYDFTEGLSVDNVHIPNKGYVDTEDNKRIKYTDTVNNLTDTSTTNPLSAYQGKLLKDAIDNIYSFIGTSATDSDTIINRLKDVFAFLASVSDEQTLVNLLNAKINYSDLAKNLTTDNDNLPLAASQGYILKGLIDALNNAETGMQAAEAIRVQNENARILAEQERAAEFATWEDEIEAKADLTNTNQTITADKVKVNEIRDISGSGNVNTKYTSNSITEEVKYGSYSSNKVVVRNDYARMSYDEFETAYSSVGVEKTGVYITVGLTDRKVLQISSSTKKMTFGGNEVIDTSNADQLFLTDAEMTTMLSEVFD